MSPRYAIYYAPAAGSPLWAFGSGVLGYDAATGAECSFIDGLAGEQDWSDLSAEPRRYGFHATLKAPFELAVGASEPDLVEALAAFASRERSTTGPALEVTALGRFLALTPAGSNPRIQEIAAGAVLAFERFRAPMSASDRERRLSTGLTPRQIMHLERFGYPYVFEDFRFHMTLTGPLDNDRIAPLLGLLAGLHQTVRASLELDQICLFRQDSRDGRFRIIHRAFLTP